MRTSALLNDNYAQPHKILTRLLNRRGNKNISIKYFYFRKPQIFYLVMTSDTMTQEGGAPGPPHNDHLSPGPGL